MIGDWNDHLWQSTLFACAAGFLTLAFRKNLAQVRYWLWLSASMKFLIPFALLMGFGNRLEWAPARRAATAVAQPAVSFTVAQISQPFRSAPQRAPSGRGDWTPFGLAGLWACGCAAVAAMRLRGWRKIREAVRASAPAGIRGDLEIRSCPGLLEPGVVGVLHPRLLLPCGIVERLTPAQLESVIAHELCHVRRRDNLTAAIHMAVETIFWFHPMVWWVGTKLVEERERACDEAVMRRGGDPRDYAEAIVSVCQWYVESPLECVSGVTGADTRKRLEAIMTGRIGQGLNGAKRLLLAGAAVTAVAGPMTVGLLIGVGNAPPIRAQAAKASPVAQTAGPVESVPVESSTPAVAPLAARPAEIPAGMEPQEDLAAAQAQGVGQGGSSAAAPVGQDLAPHPPKPEGISQEEYARRLEYAIAHFATKSGDRTLLGPLGGMYVKYGPPDRIDDHSSDAQRSQIWQYNFLADFGSPAEFEFPMRDGAPQDARINSPAPSATFMGMGEVPRLELTQVLLRGGPANGQWAQGLPGRHASMDIYRPKGYRVLNVPFDGLSGSIRVGGLVHMVQDGVTKIVANFTEKFDQVHGGVAQMNFTLDPGDYVCDVVVLEQSTARLFGEKVEFQVK